MPNNPLLIFPTPTDVDKGKLPSGPQPTPHLPSARRQGERLTPKLRELQQAFQGRGAAIHDDPAGAPPEQVVVFETVGSVENFLVAVKNTPGMSWLADWAEEEIPQDDDFYIEGKPDELVSGRLYLVMSNQQAIDQLISLFGRYRRNPGGKFDRGLNNWKKLFAQLHDVRRWSVQDRLHETGVLEAFQEDVANQQEPIRFEAELWCRDSADEQERAFEAFRAVVEEEGGRCVGQCCLPDIAYHGVLVAAPRAAIQPLLEQRETRLVRADQVMFFRPLGQAAVPHPDELAIENLGLPIEDFAAPQGEPLVALLDGLPLENHQVLAGRLTVDDPDNWAAESPAASRYHGTAMASLIIRGELDANQPPLNRPLYVRPALRPDPRAYRSNVECVPPDTLMVDLLYRAVRRIVEGEGELPPAAPTVRVINISIGDPAQPFNRYLSSTARLLDWLAHKYNLLFVVSAGNYLEDIDLGVARAELNLLGPPELQSEFLRALQLNERNRKILSPAEAINALTVGALHKDQSPWAGGPAVLINPYVDGSMPSPYGRFGPGFRRSIKPELFTAGGRALYRERLGGDGAVARVGLVGSTAQPGQRVACPGTRPGETDASCHNRGTSNAAALVTRASSFALESLLELRDEPNGELFDDQNSSVVVKALLVHGATWGEASETLRDQLCRDYNARSAREYLSRFVGYGAPEFSPFTCHDQQATIIGYGSLSDGEAHAFQIPLPPSLQAQAIWRRIRITLAWNAPINPRSQKYRIAQLWFNSSTAPLRVDGRDAWWQSVRRGTVQHEIREGELAPAYPEGATIEVRVNCKAEAGRLLEPARYGLIATLEVREGVDIPIYDEIRTRLHAPVLIAPP